jgi:transposase, IS30 family
MHTHLTRDDRVTLLALLRAEHSQAECARQLRVDKSTITNELKRVGGRALYNASVAQANAKKKRQTSKQKTRIPHDQKLKRYIVRRIKSRASPDSIAGRWKYLHGSTLSHQTIYDWVRSDRKDLIIYLPHQGKKRRIYGTKMLESPYQQAKRYIDERPQEVAERRTLGHWEGDTIVGRERTSRILTHVERLSLFLVADKIDHDVSDTVHKRTVARMKSLECKTITYDGGSEFALHRMIEEDTGAMVYTAHPGRPCERPWNEHTNGLLRRFFPKGSCFATITQKDVDRAVRFLNHYPRKSLGYRTPYEIYRERCVSSWN